ncbi:hypothetical protein M2163_001182 [Streptomyces sp. SAI-135]|uniref:hypothetical protein n=1 Tax=unclassified Streptomyces TaxID=2593676 RepID=UPI002474A67D|nr:MULTISPECIES: hypothetical protein [unclassified Streptomyces]MDH6521825.1 hypothetical protein [Streptomyces sp. SAI-090]MDH6614074.1 hypothetical protein [Streptomyces sp. SAI-135]
MTPLRTPPPAAAAHHPRPFTHDPGRWRRKSNRALRTGHVRGHTCTAACELVLIHERTSWGWLTWTVPADGSQPEIPHQIGVLTPGATRAQRLAARWLTRRPARHLAADTVPGSLRLSTAAIALISVMIGLFALSHGVPLSVTVPAALLAPLLTQYLPGQFAARAREHVRIVEADAACQYLQRLAALHTCLLQAAAGSNRYEVRRSAEIGHNLLWDAAGLLHSHDIRTAPPRLIDRERLMVQLADQVAPLFERTRTHSATGEADQPRRSFASGGRSRTASNQRPGQHLPPRPAPQNGRECRPCPRARMTAQPVPPTPTCCSRTSRTIPTYPGDQHRRRLVRVAAPSPGTTARRRPHP